MCSTSQHDFHLFLCRFSVSVIEVVGLDRPASRSLDASLIYDRLAFGKKLRYQKLLTLEIFRLWMGERKAKAFKSRNLLSSDKIATAFGEQNILAVWEYFADLVFPFASTLRRILDETKKKDTFDYGNGLKKVSYQIYRSWSLIVHSKIMAFPPSEHK